MNEQFIVKLFAPAKALDIGFKKDTLSIVDRGIGENCVAKFFPMSKCPEEDLIMKRHTVSQLQGKWDCRIFA